MLSPISSSLLQCLPSPRIWIPAHILLMSLLLLSFSQDATRSGYTGHQEGSPAAEGAAAADLQREAAARRRRGFASGPRQGSRAAGGSMKDRLQQMFLRSDSEEEEQEDGVDEDEYEGYSRSGEKAPGGAVAVSRGSSPVSSAVPLQQTAASPGVAELSFDSEVAESPLVIPAAFAEPGALGGQRTSKRGGSSLRPSSPALGPTDADVLIPSEERYESIAAARSRPRGSSRSPGRSAPHYLQSPLQQSPGTGARGAPGPSSGFSAAAAAAGGASSPRSARRALEAELEAELEDTGEEEEPGAGAEGLGRGAIAEVSRDDVEEVEAMVASLREGLKGLPALEDQEGEGEGGGAPSREPPLVASIPVASSASAAAIASFVKPRWPPAETPGSLSTMSREDVADTCYHGSSENSDGNLSAWSDAPATAHHSRGASAGGVLSALGGGGDGGGGEGGGGGGAALTFPQLPEGPSSPGAGLWLRGSGELSPAMRGAAENPLFQAEEAAGVVSGAGMENPLFNPDEPLAAAAPGAAPFVSPTPHTCQSLPPAPFPLPSVIPLSLERLLLGALLLL